VRPRLWLDSGPMSSKILVIFLFGLSFDAGAAPCSSVRTVPIRLLNEAAVPPTVLTAAQQEAVYILKSLCVHLEWTAESVSDAMEMRTTPAPVGPGVTKGSLGITFLDQSGTNRGTVFFSRVFAVERTYGRLVSLERLLGCVLAHEIGHLLLGTKAHSRGGIMVANFDQAELLKAGQRRLLFTRDDREMFFTHQVGRVSIPTPMYCSGRNSREHCRKS